MLPLIVAGVLFFVLSPGVLLTIPPGKKTTTAAAVHALVFMAALYALMRFFPGVVEGFKPNVKRTPNPTGPCSPSGEIWQDPTDPMNCSTCSASGQWKNGCIM